MARSRSNPRLCCCVCFALLCAIAIVVTCVVVFSRLGCSDGDFKLAAVAADSLICSEVGRDMLLRGGSAVDGAIAALLCTSLVNPQSMGLGGGAIFTILDKRGNVKIINSRETVPQNVKADLLNKCPKQFKFMKGSEWIGVPGEIRGYERAHRLYGKLPWATLFQPAIDMARDGFPMPPVLALYLQNPQIKMNVETSPLCEIFCNENKTVLKHGETLRYPQLAQTMATIAEKGADVFYTGSIATDLVKDVQDAALDLIFTAQWLEKNREQKQDLFMAFVDLSKAFDTAGFSETCCCSMAALLRHFHSGLMASDGGTLSMKDLASFQAKVTDAWKVSLGDYTLHIPPPPAGGAILGFILNIMKGFNLTPSSMEGDQKALTFHRYIEASKFANGQKKSLRDPSFSLGKEASRLIEDDFAERVRAMISSNTTHGPHYYNLTPSMDHSGTTHLSVLAVDGTAVAVTSTINHIFGSYTYSSKTGIILNNELLDFCGITDSISTGEQPPSSMAPAVMRSPSRGKTLVIGASGGSMITAGMALSIMNHVWFGKSLSDAIAAPVVYVDSNNTVNFEPDFDKTVMEQLKDLKHTVGTSHYFFNVVNAVSEEGRCISAVSDRRKKGQAAGY